MNKDILTGIIGFAGGLLGGAVGDGGGAIMMPGILYGGVIKNYKTAMGSVLLGLSAPLSIGAAYLYWKKKNMIIKTGVILAIFNFFGAIISAYVVLKYISEKKMFLVYAIYLLLLSFVFFYKYNKQKN